jgi:hypothetical protein
MPDPDTSGHRQPPPSPGGKALRVFTLVVAALSLTMTSAHVLEMPAKMRLSPQLYSAINGVLYRWFAIVGGIYTIVAIVSAWAFAWAARRHPLGRWARTGAILLSLAFVSWLVLVLPVNQAIAAAVASAPQTTPELWTALRARWEYGHLIGFLFNLLGFCVLCAAAVADVPARARSPIHTSAATTIRAGRDSVFALYARWQDWPRTFGRTIRGVRLVREEGNVLSIDVDHVEGHVPNTMSLVPPDLIVLEERKRRYSARFENRFEPGAEGRTRYAVTADVTLRGGLRWLRFLAKPIIRARIRRFVLDPIRHAAEAAPA